MEAPGEISLLTILLPLAGIVFIIAVGVILLNMQFQKNLVRQKLAQEELKTIHQQELLRSGILAQEEERKRIAQDMHDELGATLSIARMHLIQLQQSTGGGASGFDLIREHLESAMVNMRRICHLLMPPQLEAFGLVETLETTAQQINQSQHISIEVHADDNFTEPEWINKIGLYRICLELISNTIRHAHADTITIRLSASDRMLRCDYTDNGTGIAADMKTNGLGLRGMHSRAVSLGGSFEDGNAEAGGYYACITIPLAQKQQLHYNRNERQN
jgi:signal transduction histidine kinase